MYRNVYTGSHAVIVVYAVDCCHSFKYVDSLMNTIDLDRKNENVLKFLVGNKCDF